MSTIMTRRSFAGLAGAGLSAFGLAACGGGASAGSAGGASTEAKTFKVGILQLVEHAALDASNEGFVAAFEEAGIDASFDQQNAQGDQSACQTIATKFVSDQVDLILAIATPAVEACAGATEEIPIVGTAVTDFASSGLVESNEAPGGNVTGSSDLTPVADQVAMIPKLFPQAKEVGVLYCSAESNSDFQAELAHKACADQGLNATDYVVSSSNEIQSVVESAADKVDVFYAPTDNTIAAGMTTVTMVADEKGKPVICGEEGMVDAGGLCTFTISYYELGKLAGQMAIRILTEGANPATMPIEYYPSDKLTFVGDDDKAEELGADMDAWAELDQ